jgi:hypothetical protein
MKTWTKRNKKQVNMQSGQQINRQACRYGSKKKLKTKYIIMKQVRKSSNTYVNK